MSDLVAKLEDRFSCDAAHLTADKLPTLVCCTEGSHQLGMGLKEYRNRHTNTNIHIEKS